MKIRNPISRRQEILLGISAVVILLACYEALSYQRHLGNPQDTTIPSLTQMLNAFIRVCSPQGHDKTRWLWQDSKITFLRLAEGVATGGMIAIILGILMGCFDRVNAFFMPILGFWKPAPATAMLAIFFALAGIGEALYTTLVSIAIIPTLALTISMSARQDVSMKKIDKAYTLGASNAEVIWDIVFPQILPKIIDSIRLQIGPMMVCLIAAELQCAQLGFGYRLRTQSRLQHLDVVYDYIIVLAAFGLLMDYGMIQFRKWLCPWFEKVK